jgi:hypothetical protein
MQGGLRPLLTVWLAWLLLMAGANLATPLYAVYAQRYQFSSLVLDAIFATYALVLVPRRRARDLARRAAAALLPRHSRRCRAVALLPEPGQGEREPWRIQWPRVPPEIRAPFARVSVTAAVVWGTLALFLSIVPSSLARS